MEFQGQESTMSRLFSGCLPSFIRWGTLHTSCGEQPCAVGLQLGPQPTCLMTAGEAACPRQRFLSFPFLSCQHRAFRTLPTVAPACPGRRGPPRRPARPATQSPPRAAARTAAAPPAPACRPQESALRHHTRRLGYDEVKLPCDWTGLQAGEWRSLPSCAATATPAVTSAVRPAQ